MSAWGSKRMALPECAAEFICVIEASYPKSTARGFRRAVSTIHDFIDRNGFDIAHLTHRHIELLIQEQVARGLCAASRVHLLILIRGYLRWLHDQRLIPISAEKIIQRWDLPKVPHYLPRPLSPEIDQLLQLQFAQSTHRFSWGFLLMRITGLRISELAQLPFDCLVSHGDGYHYLKVPIGKFNSERIVPLTKDGVQWVRRIQETNMAIWNKHRIGSPPFLNMSKQLAGVNVRTLSMFFRKTVVNLPNGLHVVPHQLRHTFATSLLNAGMGLYSIMRLLGHRSPNMTLKYAQISPETLRREYFTALERIKIPYVEIIEPVNSGQQVDPERSIADVKRWVLKHTDTKNDDAQYRSYLLLKQLDRIRTKIAELPPMLTDDF